MIDLDFMWLLELWCNLMDSNLNTVLPVTKEFLMRTAAFNTPASRHTEQTIMSFSYKSQGLPAFHEGRNPRLRLLVSYSLWTTRVSSFVFSFLVGGGGEQKRFIIAVCDHRVQWQSRTRNRG